MRFSGHGEHEFSNVRYVEEVKAYSYDVDDLTTSGSDYGALKIPLPIDAIVTAVGYKVDVGWDSGDVLTIGDADAENTYIASGDVAEETVGDVKFKYVDKAYGNTGYLLVKHATAPSVGAGTVFIKYFVKDASWRESMP